MVHYLVSARHVFAGLGLGHVLVCLDMFSSMFIVLCLLDLPALMISNNLFALSQAYVASL